MKRFAFVIALVALASGPAWAGSGVTILNTWQEVEQSSWDPESSFCTTDTAHPVVTWMLAKDAETRFIAKVTDPTGEKTKFATDYQPFNAGSHFTCLACQFGFPDGWPNAGIHSMKLRIQARGAGSAKDQFAWNTIDCAAAALASPPLNLHE